MNGNVCWGEYLKPVLSIRWPSPRVDLFTRVDWPPQFITYTADIHHISALRDTHAIIISQQRHTTGHMTVCPLLWLPLWFIKWLTGWCCGFLYGFLYNTPPPPVTIGLWSIISLGNLCSSWMFGRKTSNIIQHPSLSTPISAILLIPSHLFQTLLLIRVL